MMRLTASGARQCLLTSRMLAIAATIGILLGIAMSAVLLWPQITAQWGEDYRFFMGATSRWWETGQFYLTHQVAGPYVATSGIDTMYPPIALLLFVPFLWLPAFLWWAIPLGILAWHIASSRPAWWSWPVLAVLAWIPRDQSIVIWGNTSMWAAAFVALGLRLGWPALLVLVKPSFAPFALIGIRRRSWWIGAAVLAVATLAFGTMWLDYIAVLRNDTAGYFGPLYSLPDYLFVAIPLVAWVARPLGPLGPHVGDIDAVVVDPEDALLPGEHVRTAVLPHR
jgi:hypothetical protein